MRAVAWVGGHSVQCHETGVVAEHPTVGCAGVCLLEHVCGCVFLGAVWVGSPLCGTVVALRGVLGSCSVVGRLDRV